MLILRAKILPAMKHPVFFALWLALTATLYVACQSDGERVQEIRSSGPNSDLILNPSSANQPTDTNQMARIAFEEPEFDFGEVREGTVVEHKYRFKNTGKVPLVIANCRSTCGCTVPEWPKEEIEPGETGEITATFNTQDRTGGQRKRIYITANTFPNETKVELFGTVNPKK